MTDRVATAARNNAAWCDAVCRAHGGAGEFRPAVWVSRLPAPPRYPNAVTLADAAHAAAQLAAVDDLQDTTLPAGWAVKDSFACLPLAARGFRVLFEAEWIWRAAETPVSVADETAPIWVRVTTDDELAAWESAWAGDAAAGGARVFPPALARDPDVAFLAARRDGAIVAGAVANRHAGAVGLSNVFTCEAGAASAWATCAPAAVRLFPALPVVGYEAGATLGLARAAGFAAVGALRVWVREPQT